MIYLELFFIFLKIGAFTFGGGYAMLPLIQKEVTAHNWMDTKSLVDFIAVSESTPGPFAVNIATYVGTEVGGFLGAVSATIGVVLPSFIIILIVAKCFQKFNQSKIVKGCMSGLKPAVVGLIGATAVSIGKNVFFFNGMKTAVFYDRLFWNSLVIFVLAILLLVKKVHPIVIIIVSAVLGIIFGCIG